MSRLRPGLAAILLSTPMALLAAEPAGGESETWFQANQEELVALYTHLHTHPELSFREVKTAERIAEELRKVGAEVTPNVGQLGVVGVLKNGPGPTVLIRTDLDALPVAEET